MSEYYDKLGNPIDWEQYRRLLADDPDYNRVSQDRIAIDGEDVFLSTVHLAINHNHWGGAPVIFETMIFVESNSGHEHHNWLARYSTLERAQRGHEEVAAQLREGRWPA